MSSTVDANVLLHASDESSPVHAKARALVGRIADGPEIAYLFWPTVMAYLRIATHRAVFARPMSIAEAVGNIEQLLARPHVRTTGEGESFWRSFAAVADDALPSGNLVPDAHLVTLMLDNDVRTIWTRDRGFRRFPRIEVRTRSPDRHAPAREGAAGGPCRLGTSRMEWRHAVMSDEPTEGAGEARPTGDAEPATQKRLTSEERLRALAGDRKPKKRGKARAGSADPQHRPGDVVDAVRERTNKDPGKNLAR